MNKFAKKALIGTAIVALILLSIESHIKNSVHDQLEEYIRQLAPLAHIQYNDVNIKLPNRLSIGHVRIIPKAPELGNFDINKIHLHFKDQDNWLVVKQLLGWGEERAPQQLSAEVIGLRLSATEFTHLENLIQQLNQQFEQQSPAMPAACGDSYFIGPRQLLAMGYDPISFNLNADYRFDESEQSLAIDLDFAMQGANHSRLNLKLLNIPALNLASGRMLRPQVERLALSYDDLGYTNRLTSYCAQQSGLERHDYIERETSRSNDEYSLLWGFIPGDNIKSAYRDFLQDPQHMHMSLEPSPTFDWLSLKDYPLSRWPEVLNMNLTVNDQAIDPIDIEQASLPSRLPILTSDSTTPTRQPTQSEAVEADLPPQFQPINKRQIRDYLGLPMRVHTPSGRTREGIFLGVEDNQIQLQQEALGGTIIISIALFGIETIEVAQ